MHLPPCQKSDVRLWFILNRKVKTKRQVGALVEEATSIPEIIGLSTTDGVLGIENTQEQHRETLSLCKIYAYKRKIFLIG